MSDQPNAAKPSEPTRAASPGHPAPAEPKPAPEQPAAAPAPRPATIPEEPAKDASVTVFITPKKLPKSGPLNPNALKEARTGPIPGSLASPAAQTSTATTGPIASSGATEQKTTFASSLTAPAEPARTNQQKCSACGNMNRLGLLICENCGSSLVSTTATIIGTKKFGQSGLLNADKEPKLNTVEVHALLSAGSDGFTESMMLRLEVEGATTPILIYPKDETSLGRRDPAGGTMPDVDLTTYAAYRMGVSRRHALLTLKNRQLQIIDLGSSNGTMVNGVKLAPHQPRPLKDGDMIALGKMSMRVIFQSGARR
jgi:hypothetical protein